MKKIALIVVGIVVVGLFGVVFFINAFSASIISAGLSKAVNLPIRIGKTDVNFSKASIRLESIRVSNPKGFTDPLMVDVPVVGIRFKPKELMQRKAHFEDVELHLKELVVVKNRDGQLNLDALKPKDKQKEKPQEKEGALSDKEKKSGFTLQIDRLNLSIGRVVYKDYSSGGEVKTQTFDINIKNREFTNITNPAALVSLIMLEALTRTTLSKILNLDLGFFKDQASGIVDKGLNLVSEGDTVVRGTAKTILGLFN